MALRRDGNSNSSASYKPYDTANSSFVKRMANRVTGIIGWRSDSQSENQNRNNSSVDSQSISQNYNDFSHPSADEDGVLPAAKRIRVQCDEENTLLQFRPSTSKELRNVCSPIQPIKEINVAGPSNRNQCIASSTPANICSSTFRNNSVQPGAKNQSPNTSLTGHLDFNLPQFSIHHRHNVTVPSIPEDVPSQSSYFDINKSLSGSFSTTNLRRPSFNVDTFSASSRRLSLSACENRSRSCISPFYSARTMYGGASALLPYGNQTASRLRSASTSKLDVFSPRSQITMQPVPSPAKSSDQETMSAAARRILDTLEKYCSPVMDAKRIPLNESDKKKPNSQQSSRGVKRKLQSLSQMMPSTADLLRLKRTEKIQDSISSAKKTVSSVPESSIAADDSSDSSSDSVELDYSGLTEDTKNQRGPLVSMVEPENEKKSESNSFLQIEPPTVSQISKLPEFSVNMFTFSKPLLLEDLDHSVDDVETPQEHSSTDEENIRASISTTSAFSPKTFSPSSNFKVTAEKVKPFSLILSPVAKEVGNPISQNKSSLPNNLVSAKVDSLKKTLVPSWTCKLCLASNDGERCSKCSASRAISVPAKSTNTNLLNEKVVSAVTSPTTTLSSSGWGDKFKRPADTWECTVCLVSNKSMDSKCVACQTPKNNVSNSSSNTNTSISGTNDLWKNLQQSTTDTWECDSCWVKNKQSDVKCVACSSAKKSESTSSPVVTGGPEKVTPQAEFLFGIDKSGTDGNVTNTTKFGTEKPAVNFDFGSVPTLASTTTTITKPTFSFGVNTATTVAISGNSGVKTETTSSPSQFQFGFKAMNSQSVEKSASNATGFNNMFLNTTSKTDDGERTATVDNKRETITFNDVSSSTNNARNPLLKSGDNDAKDSVFKTPKFVGIASKSPTITKENGAEERSQSVFNDISSSTESPSRRKIPAFSSSLVFSKESTNGLPNANPSFSITNGATAVSSSSNIFSNSVAAPPLVSSGAKLTNDTQPSFAAIMKKEKTFDDKNSGKLFPTNSFGVSSSSSTSNSLFSQLPSSGGFAAPKKTEPLAFGAGNANFTGGGAPTFSFGANATASQPSGGFTFNGPKAEDSSALTPKFNFGSSTANNAPAFGGAASSQFTFNVQQTSNSSSADQRPLTNSMFVAATAKTPQQPNAQPQSQITNSISAFGNNVFGAGQQQSSQPLGNLAKKSGGFSFAAPSQFAAQPMNNFSSFTNQSATTAVVDNQEQSLLNSNAASTSSAFVFGNPNQTAQPHNFNLTVPPRFNFTGGNNSSIAFSAQATNAAPTAPTARRFKKAVRRTAK